MEWDLKLIIKDEKDFDNLVAEAKTAVEKFAKKWSENLQLSANFSNNSDLLLESLKEYEELQANHGTDNSLYFYYELKDAIQQNNPETKARINKIIESSTDLENQLQFYTYNISKTPAEFQKSVLDNPQFKEYHHLLSRLFEEAKYLLTEQEEKILNMTYKTGSYNWTQMLENFFSKSERKVYVGNGKYEIKSISEIGSLIDSPDPKVRLSCSKAIQLIRAEHSDAGEHEFNSILEYKTLTDKLRKIDRPDTLRHLADDIDTEVVDALVESVTSNFELTQRFYKLKAKLVGVKKLKTFEANLSLENLMKLDNLKRLQYEFKDAEKLIHNVFFNLHPSFSEIFETFLKEKRIDVMPRKNKSSGAFCATGSIKDPIYILLNFGGKVDDVMTLAHELGHGINSTLSRTQSELNYGTVLSTAEVASTFMEDFVLEELLSGVDDLNKLMLIMKKLNDDVGTIFMQVAAYTFEQKVHKTFREEGYLSHQRISEIFSGQLNPVFGAAVDTKSFTNRWVNWWHFRTPFYVYSYASGLLISKSLQASFRKDKSFINKVIEFLSAGTSKSPAEIFADLDIDIKDKSFWSKGISEIEVLLLEAENLAKKLELI